MIDTNKVKGALYGQAIGDALGMGAEFLDKRATAARFPEDLTDYGQIVLDGVRKVFRRGEWTDDTEQALCLLDTYLKTGDLAPTEVAKAFHDWLKKDGRGCGRLTSGILRHPDFLHNPHMVAEGAWIESGKQSAPNGAAMRTSVVGLMKPDDTGWTVKKAESCSKVTHADPRCVASAVAISVATADLVMGRDINEAFREAAARANSYHPEAMEFMTADLDGLDLDEGMGPGQKMLIGYTYKTLGAGFYALGAAKHLTDGVFLRGIVEIIMEGGDADTNAAVAGAMLGAWVGFDALPPHLVRGLVGRESLDRRLGQLEKMWKQS